MGTLYWLGCAAMTSLGELSQHCIGLMTGKTDTLSTGLLRVAGGDVVYWETSGDPEGRRAICLHGRPGRRLCSGGYRRHFDLNKYRRDG